MTQILSLLPTFKQKCAKLEAKWQLERENAPEDAYEGYKDVSMAGSNPEVIDHWPPQYIIGSPIEQMTEEVHSEDTDDLTVKVYLMTCEYMYSNPTGMFNLSLPAFRLNNHYNFRAKHSSYIEYKKAQQADSGEPSDLQDSNNDTQGTGGIIGR